MQVKILELRDAGTFIPLLCVDMNPDIAPLHARDFDSEPQEYVQRYYLRRMGYPCDGRPNIAIAHLSAGGQPFSNDPYSWGGRTYPVAHAHIIEHWDELKDGDVICVETILGERATPKISERMTSP